MSTNKKPNIIAMEATVSILAGENADSPAKFTVEAYTGGAMELNGWDKPVVVDLQGMEFGNSLIANLDHQSSQRVGHVTDHNVDNGKLILSGVVSSTSAAAREVVADAKQQFPWQASIEARPKELEVVRAKQTVQVNGQTFTGPLIVARKSVLKGFAFVPHGADDNTTVAIAASAASLKESSMTDDCKKWIEAMGFKADDLTDEQEKNLIADYEGREGKREKPAAKKIEAKDAISNELLEVERREELNSITAAFLDTLAPETKTREFLSGVEGLQAQAIEEKWTPNKYDTELLRRSMVTARTVSAPRDRNRLNDDILKAAICQAGGLQNIDKHFTDQTLQAAHDRFKEGIGLNELLCICAQDRGFHPTSLRANIDVQRAAFGQTAGPGIQASGFSTLSLPGILGDSAYKFLLEGWGGGEMTWADIADIVSVRDFKTITQYKLSGSLKYEKVGKTGEIKHGTVTEDSYTVKADTYGKMFAVTREDIINDDLNALSQVPRELGYGANEAFNEVFWTLFLSNPGSFFHSNNGNTSSGVMSSSAALATIAAAEEKFFAQTKPNGQPLGILPNVMLMPNGSYRVAQAAMASPLVVGGSTTVPNVNTFQSEYKVVRSAYLSNTSYSGYSTVKWYLLCVRPGFAVIQAAFLNGQRAPMIESASADFNTLGIQMRGVHDFGVNMFEYRAGVQGSGA